VTRRLIGCGLVLGAHLFAEPGAVVRPGAGASALSAPAADGTPQGLDAIYAAGRALRDTNADGVIDAVAARVVVPAEASAEDLEAAANIAARLGFETTALTFPIVVRDSDVTDPAAVGLPVLVGRGNAFLKTLAARGAITLGGLAAGQGLVEVVRSPLGGPDGVVVVGGDEAGTLAAGIELAARLPRVWNMSGITLSGIERQAMAFARRQGIEVRRAVINRLVVDAERRGLAAVHIVMEMPAAAVARATAAFRDLDAAHRRGRQPSVLSFAEVASLVIEIAAAGGASEVVDVQRAGLNSRTLTPPVDPDEFAPEPTMGERGGPPEPRSAPARPYDLTNAFTIDGWLGDAYVDLIPDRLDTTLVVGDATDGLAAAHVATRLGLETTGVALPLTRRDEKVREPPTEPNPIIVGRGNTLTQDLLKIGKVRVDDLAPGEGAVQVVPRAFGNATATVVVGADRAGTEAAGLYLAKRVPHLWAVARGALTMDDLATDMAKFLNAKTAAAHGSLAVGELKALLDELKGKTIESFEAKLFLEKADAGLEKVLAAQVEAAIGGVRATVTSQAVTDAVPVFDEKLEIPWEADELRAKLKADVLPVLRPGSSVEVEARVSESPKVRSELANEIRTLLEAAGAGTARVRVSSAYKQGYFWMTEDVVPALKGKGARSIRVKVKPHTPDLSKKFKFYTAPSRWLHELYPVDEIVRRELGIPFAAFGKELDAGARETYAVEAIGAGGRVIYRSTFSPKVVEREYLDSFPGWSRVDVTTGWVTATVDGRPVVDARIQTDTERFWDHYQGTVLPKVRDHVMKVTGGRPTSDKQPFFRDLDVEVWMSEPDFAIGVDEERVSALESLHEDVYFVTLDLFAAMGRTITRSRLNAPGKILPIIHPERAGRPGEARVVFAGNAATKPKLEITYREKGAQKPTTVSRDLNRIDASAPTVIRAVVTGERVREIELQVEPKDDKEASRAADAIDALVRLQSAGLFRDTLSYEGVDRVALSIVLRDARTRRVVSQTSVPSPSRIRAGAGRPSGRIVGWDRVIGPDDAEAMVRTLAAFPEVEAYKIGDSYRGRELSVLELTEPTPSERVSVPKLSAAKPTVFIMGRQHANEVSSTGHILRLAELMATDPQYRAILKKINVILVPVQNPDGAAMAYELQKLTPTHMLHAGRYSALGMDVSSRTGGLLPEAEVEGRVWREWLPDIYLNPHGYPSHEWVQPFSGYLPPGFRSYWSTRGWYTMMSGLRDPRFPAHEEATRALRESIVAAINSDPGVKAMNLRTQDRYARWAHGFSPHVFGIEVYKDVMVYYTDPESGEPRGNRRAAAASAGGLRRATIASYPQVTFNSGMTEAPDETAQGAWLDLVTRAGFAFLMAHVDYLRNGQVTVERIEENGQRDGSVITTLRVRPVLPRR